MTKPIYNENAILRRQFSLTGHEKVSEFVREKKSQITAETYSKVLYRDKAADLRTLLIMSNDLGFSNHDISEMLRKRGEITIARLIAPAELTGEEQQILDKIRAIKNSPQKMKLVNDLLETLGG